MTFFTLYQFSMLLKYMYLVVAALLLSYIPSGAQCTGSLGTPVVNVTFGQGSNPGNVVSSAVPGASTAFNYKPASGNPPSNTVLDGDYALLNQVPNNSNWHIGTKDHTGNPGGYMALFNGTATPTEFYRQTIANLCPGTTYELAAWLLNVVNSATSGGAAAPMPNVTFRLVDGNNNDLIVPFSSGPIPASNIPFWNQYATTFTTPPGVNSVVLILSSEAVGGIGTSPVGNDLALDDITLRPCGPLTGASFSATSTTLQRTVCNTETVNLYGTVSGGLSNPTYQWQISPDGVNWTDVAGATSLNFSLPAQAQGNYQLRLLSAQAGNIGSVNCRFVSGTLLLTSQSCYNCSDTCYWKATGNNIINGNNIFGTLTDHDIRIQTSAKDRGIITKDGLLGWNTTAPTAYLHIDCNGHNEWNGLSDVRFENLEMGMGNVMVIDEPGNVWDSKIPLQQFLDNSEKIEALERNLAETNERYDKLQTEVTEMKKMLEAILERNGSGGNGNGKPILYQNTPNPFAKATIIGYFINDLKKDAYIALYSLSGNELDRHMILKEGKGSIVVDADKFASGVYLYSLIIDDVKVDTKKMILSK
jgi:hypothetical protein